ncbi:MAG: hypothetical protein KKF44_07185 [Nanoarchaeota archaeon]|nr:hypothetical protein [Nanoarchaeota archaeon]
MKKKIDIYGPIGTKKFFEYMFRAFVFENTIDYEIHEIKKELLFETPDFFVYAHPLDHGIDTFGFRIVEKDKRRIKLNYIKKLGIPEGPLLGDLQNNKTIVWNKKKILPKDATYIVSGKVVAIINDTLLCDNCNKLAQDADLLICESAYSKEHEEKAREYKHLTSEQAAFLASRNSVKKLVLTHFSQRYKTVENLCDEAKIIFKETTCAYDLMKLSI